MMPMITMTTANDNSALRIPRDIPRQRLRCSSVRRPAALSASTCAAVQVAPAAVGSVDVMTLPAESRAAQNDDVGQLTSDSALLPATFLTIQELAPPVGSLDVMTSP